MNTRYDEKVQVVMVMVASAIITAALMGLLSWSCDFAPISQCIYGTQK